MHSGLKLLLMAVKSHWKIESSLNISEIQRQPIFILINVGHNCLTTDTLVDETLHLNADKKSGLSINSVSPKVLVANFGNLSRNLGNFQSR